MKLEPPLRPKAPEIPIGGYSRGTPAQMAMCAAGRHTGNGNWCRWCCASLQILRDREWFARSFAERHVDCAMDSKCKNRIAADTKAGLL